MPFSIALAGKGGTGKTTVAGLLIKYMIMKGKTPILAVDADSNSNLNEVLGVKVSDTLGNAREDMKKGSVPNGMTKDVFISMRLEEAIIEADNFDLVVMGQPEGSGCYCAANSLLAGFLERLTGNYPYIVMDNEAGMEHISRLTTRNVDVLLIVTDTSRRGIQAAERIHHLAHELKIGVSRSCIVVNQAKNGFTEADLHRIAGTGPEFLGSIPEDDAVYDYDFNGRPTIEIPEDNKAVKAAFEIFEKIVF
ncbi:MAG: carbon monoxide dehydrogenase [Desulfobacteraceae bacterium IS3]|nr:MAG: carbon monoxide dehydrogenase [Desulfobacteraceae bacterium IS3]